MMKNRVSTADRDDQDRSGMRSCFKRAILLNFALLFLFQIQLLSADSLVREQSFTGNYIAETTDRELSRKWVEFLEEMRSKMASFMGLEAQSEHRVLVRQVKSLPGGIRSSFHAWVSDGKLDFYIEVTDPLDLAQFKREILKTFIYDRILPKNKKWVSGEGLPEIPFWLMEGLFQKFEPMEDEIAEKIVKRMVKVQKAPPLKTVLEWKEWGSNKLEVQFQKTFSYALLLWLTKDIEQRNLFWSSLSAGMTRWMDADSEEMESRWQRYLSSFKVKDEVFFGWEETQRAVSNLLFVAAPVESAESRETYLVKWDELRGVKSRAAMIPVLVERERDLLLLEVQAHFSWRPFLFHYRSAIHLLVDEFKTPPQRKSNAYSRPISEINQNVAVKKTTYEDLVTLAKKDLESVQSRASGISDYLDWFLVSFSSDEDRFMFEDYFQTVGKGNEFEVQGGDLYRQQGIKVEKRGD
ncbi:MAG: hypothetical protein V4507_01050 [Verrucomicrobiota bacterium]